MILFDLQCRGFETKCVVVSFVELAFEVMESSLKSGLARDEFTYLTNEVIKFVERDSDDRFVTVRRIRRDCVRVDFRDELRSIVAPIRCLPS